MVYWIARTVAVKIMLRASLLSPSENARSSFTHNNVPMSCRTCFCTVADGQGECGGCGFNPPPPNAIDCFAEVPTCIACDDTVCPFHCTQAQAAAQLCRFCFTEEGPVPAAWADNNDDNTDYTTEDSDDDTDDENEYRFQQAAQLSFESAPVAKRRKLANNDAVPYVKHLHDNTTSTEDYERCTICLDGYDQGVSVAVLECAGSHRFHTACIDRWLFQEAATCPLCTSVLTE